MCPLPQNVWPWRQRGVSLAAPVIGWNSKLSLEYSHEARRSAKDFSYLGHDVEWCLALLECGREKVARSLPSESWRQGLDHRPGSPPPRGLYQVILAPPLITAAMFIENGSVRQAPWADTISWIHSKSSPKPAYNGGMSVVAQGRSTDVPRFWSNLYTCVFEGVQLIWDKLEGSGETSG